MATVRFCCGQATSVTAAVGDKRVRAGSATKRAAILAAARELFLRDGVERTSMDAVAARAEVSKRTVYDYYGDKEHLLLGVVEDAEQSLLRSFRTALDTHVGVGAIRTPADLEQALTGFALEIGVTVITSADYATVFTLIAEQRSQLAELESRLMASTEPEDALAERLTAFHRAGILDAPDPRLAADHFNALTVLLAYSHHSRPTQADPDQVRRTMITGVAAFMRAYAPR